MEEEALRRFRRCECVDSSYVPHRPVSTSMTFMQGPRLTRALGEYILDDEAYARPSWLNFSKSPEPPAGLEGILAKVFKKAANKSSTDSMFPDSGDDMLMDGH